ncbi:MAG: gluzincin family metallopeptidase [Endomicrobiales bacterium]
MLTYHLGNTVREVTALKLVIGIFIVEFSLVELLPSFETISLGPAYMPLGLLRGIIRKSGGLPFDVPYQGEAFKGRLAEKLGQAVTEYAAARMLEEKILVFLFLKQSTNVAGAAVKAKLADTERTLSGAEGEYMTFFTLELVALDDAALARLYAQDPVVARHRPWIEHQRVFKPHVLSEPVESALTKRSPFGPGAWSEFFDELEADIEAEYRGEKKTLTELLHLLTESRDAGERAELLRIINDSLKGTFAKYSAQTLYMVAGFASVEDRERRYKTPMEPRNKANRVPDAVVEALHRAVNDAAPLAKLYYRMKAALLGLKTLKWSDRNAPLPFSEI